MIVVGGCKPPPRHLARNEMHFGAAQSAMVVVLVLRKGRSQLSLRCIEVCSSLHISSDGIFVPPFCEATCCVDGCAALHLEAGTWLLFYCCWAPLLCDVSASVCHWKGKAFTSSLSAQTSAGCSGPATSDLGGSRRARQAASEEKRNTFPF